MKILMSGIAVMALIWAVQVQATELTWQKDIKPLFDKKCVGCHGAHNPEHDEFSRNKKENTEKSIGMRMDTYSHLITYVGWPYTGALIRRLDDGTSREDKKPGNMYQFLGNTEEECQANLSLFKTWVGSWNVKRWKEISKDELNAIKAKY